MQKRGLADPGIAANDECAAALAHCIDQSAHVSDLTISAVERRRRLRGALSRIRVVRLAPCVLRRV
jgi:hypothetical protein